MSRKTVNMNRCRKPLIQLCDGASRLVINLGACAPCSVEPNRLILTQGGCPVYEEICEPAEASVTCGCPPNGHTVAPVIRVREVPKKRLIYPLHQIDEDGNAVFILDNKLSMLDYGRVEAAVEFGTNGCYEFDIEYTHGAVKVRAVDVAYMEC